MTQIQPRHIPLYRTVRDYPIVLGVDNHIAASWASKIPGEITGFYVKHSEKGVTLSSRYRLRPTDVDAPREVVEALVAGTKLLPRRRL